MDRDILQLWNVIGTWVASIGTVGAVITSLWLAYHQGKVKLKINAGERLVITRGSNEKPRYCHIGIVNIGNKPAKVINIGWSVRRNIWKKKVSMIQLFGFPESANVPVTLQEGEDATFLVPYRYRGNDDDWIVDFPKKLVGNEKHEIIKSLKVWVHTSSGQSFRTKVENNLIETLTKSYKKRMVEKKE